MIDQRGRFNSREIESRTQKEDKAAGGVESCKVATGQGTVLGSEKSRDSRKTEAGSGKHDVLSSWLRSGTAWSPRREERRLGAGKLGTGGGNNPI
jgi:hypothetical protein